MPTLEGLPECIKETRRHLRALEDAAKVQATHAGLTEEEIAKVVTHSLNYHRREYDTWMQTKLDKFADIPWGESALQDARSLTPSRTPSQKGSMKGDVSVRGPIELRRIAADA